VRYTKLTQVSVEIAAQMAATAAKQLAASAQPKLTISFRGHTFVEGDSHNVMFLSDAIVTNVGDAPVKLRRMMAGVIGTSAPSALGDVPIPTGLVLMPQEPFTNKLQLTTGTRTVNQQTVHPTVIVDCSDLAEVSEHRFRFDEVEGLRHSLGFK
jgi:hypothetical protein